MPKLIIALMLIATSACATEHISPHVQSECGPCVTDDPMSEPTSNLKVRTTKPPPPNMAGQLMYDPMISSVAQAMIDPTFFGTLLAEGLYELMQGEPKQGPQLSTDELEPASWTPRTPAPMDWTSYNVVD